MSQGNGTTAAEKAARQERLQQLSRQLRQGANRVRENIATQLKDAASNIRKEMTGSEGVPEDAVKRVNEVAERLDDVAGYLETHTIEDIETEATERVRRNPWGAVLAALIVGLLIGILISRD